MTPSERSLCHACAMTVATETLPGLSRRAAWKLVLLPLLGMACLLALASKGAPLRDLSAEQLTFLAAWLIPFACGLGLLMRPLAPLAFLGSIVSLTLLCVVLVPPAIADFNGQRVLDLVIVAAAPLVAIKDAFALDRAQRQRHLLLSMANA